VDGDRVLDQVQGRTLEIIAEIEPGTAERIDIQRGFDIKTRIVYNTKPSKLFISRSDKTEAGTISAFTPAFGAPIPLDKTSLKLHIFVDESSVEVFAQDGLFSITGQTFVNSADQGVALFAEKGDMKVTRLEIYALNRIWSPDRPQNSPDSITSCSGDNR
jgi:sucrose-6-phosphate hydrolase SacC (GH32 family)